MAAINWADDNPRQLAIDFLDVLKDARGDMPSSCYWALIQVNSLQDTAICIHLSLTVNDSRANPDIQSTVVHVLSSPRTASTGCGTCAD
jgi:hypothetical protein